VNGSDSEETAGDVIRRIRAEAERTGETEFVKVATEVLSGRGGGKGVVREEPKPVSDSRTAGEIVKEARELEAASPLGKVSIGALGRLAARQPQAQRVEQQLGKERFVELRRFAQPTPSVMPERPSTQEPPGFRRGAMIRPLRVGEFTGEQINTPKEIVSSIERREAPIRAGILQPVEQIAESLQERVETVPFVAGTAALGIGFVKGATVDVGRVFVVPR